MTRTEILLTVLGEECVETAQRVSKAIRFTPEEIQPGQELTNAERIVYEFNDILACMEILEAEGILKGVIDRDSVDKKKAKIEKYLNYSAELGAYRE